MKVIGYQLSVIGIRRSRLPLLEPWFSSRAKSLVNPIWVSLYGFGSWVTKWYQYPLMKTADIADLRNNFRVIAAWISDGESVEIRKRDHNLLANPADVRPNDL